MENESEEKKPVDSKGFLILKENRDLLKKTLVPQTTLVQLWFKLLLSQTITMAMSVNPGGRHRNGHAMSVDSSGVVSEYWWPGWWIRHYTHPESEGGWLSANITTTELLVEWTEEMSEEWRHGIVEEPELKFVIFMGPMYLSDDGYDLPFLDMRYMA